MKVTVNKCRYTGKLFEDDKKYAAHLRKMRAEQKEKRESAIIHSEFHAWLAKEKESIRNPEDIPDWILENQLYLMKSANALKMGTWASDKFYPATDRYTRLAFETIRFSPCVSNSHSCPKGGVTNWGREDSGKPEGYPGWSGYVKGTLARDKKHMHSYPYSAIFKLIDIHTGSGGGGNDGWGYDFKIFNDDWPVLGEAETYRRLMSAK